MSYVVALSEAAIADLLGIRAWIAGEADGAVADGFIRRLRHKIDQLAIFPYRGEHIGDIRPGSRKLSFERSYLILYRIAPDRVLIDRVISTRRDIAKLP